MLGTVKTTLDEDGKRVGFVSVEEVVESDMIMEEKKKKKKKKKKRDASLWMALIPCRNTEYLAFQAYSSCEHLLIYIEFVHNTR
jgi:hypothetical protein